MHCRLPSVGFRISGTRPLLSASCRYDLPSAHSDYCEVYGFEALMRPPFTQFALPTHNRNFANFDP